MENLGACLLASGFLGASIYTMMKCTDCEPFQSYQASLTPELQQVYQEVRNERKRLYVQGKLLGTALALAYLYATQGSINLMGNVCVFVAIAMGTQFLYYMLMPKSVHMLPLLQSTEQVQGWHQVYEHMKRKYYMGFVLGMIGYALLGYVLA